MFKEVTYFKQKEGRGFVIYILIEAKLAYYPTKYTTLLLRDRDDFIMIEESVSSS